MMQFLLTAEELNTLNSKARQLDEMPTMEDLEETCKKIATTFITVILQNEKTLTHGCPHVDTGKYPPYCDDCPVKDICPLPKNWSK